MLYIMKFHTYIMMCIDIVYRIRRNNRTCPNKPPPPMNFFKI